MSKFPMKENSGRPAGSLTCHPGQRDSTSTSQSGPARLWLCPPAGLRDPETFARAIPRDASSSSVAITSTGERDERSEPAPAPR